MIPPASLGPPMPQVAEVPATYHGPPTHVADPLEQAARDVELADLEGSVLGKRQAQHSRHLNRT
jgi:hypothetical protein